MAKAFTSLLMLGGTMAGLIQGHLTTASPDSAMIRPNLVALGASVTFGTSLRHGWRQPSQQAYPYLIAHKYDMSVTDLGVPGWTSHDLLDALNRNPGVDRHVSTANLVTVQIGGDDIYLLMAVISDIQASNAKIKDAEIKQVTKVFSTAYLSNLSEIVRRIHGLAPHANILLYNAYNPFTPTNKDFPQISKLFQLFNEDVAQTGARFHVPVANVYKAFSGHQRELVKSHNVHPTVMGQQVLAKVGESALAESQLIGASRHRMASQP